MLNKLIFSTMLMPIIVNCPLSVTYNTNNYQSVTKNSDELSSSILEDIANYSENQKLILDSMIVFKQHTLKELFVIGNIRANQKQWYQYTDHTFAYPIQFDFNERIAYGQIYNSFEQIYKDPDPGWCDPVGARWNDRQKTIAASKQTLYGKVKETASWFGNEINMNFQSPEIADIDDGYTLAYSPHSYFTHVIRMYSNGSYTKKAINQNFLMNEITNNKFIESFFDKNELPLTNLNMVWNSETIKSQPNVYGFDENLKIIKTLNIAKQTIQNLEQLIIKNTNNGVWENKDFTLSSVQNLIKKIRNYQFDDFKQLKKLNNRISQNQIGDISGNFLPLINKLNDDLQNDGLISKNDFINLDNVDNFYKIILLFLKNNEVYFNFEINKQEKAVCVWDGLKFTNLLEQLQYNNFNYLNVQLKSININYVGDMNQTSCYNKSFFLDVKDNPKMSTKYNFEILYRYNALNINSNIAIVDTKKGVLINSNKFVSELINTNPKDINQLNIKNKQLILDNINDILNKENPHNIKSDLLDISLANKSSLIDKFSINELKDKAKLLNIKFDNWFDFVPNNYDGIFYAILKIDNWKFIDKTNGDFTNNFKKQFYALLNTNNINVVELKSSNQTISFDNAEYFLCRFRTNRVIFDYYENKPIIHIENIDLVKQQVRHFFDKNQNNWYLSNKIHKWSDFFFNYEESDYDVVLAMDKLDIDLEIDSFKFQSPIEKQQFQVDLTNNPIFNFLNRNSEYEIIQQNEYGYLTSKGQTTLNLKVNLSKFLDCFYNSDLNNIENTILKHKDAYQKDINRKSEIKKTLNWLPSTILISCASILIILLSILITYIKRKYKVI